MIRPSGLYAVLAGETLPVELHGSDYVKLAGPYGMVRHELDELDDFLSVRTSATWRGGSDLGEGCRRRRVRLRHQRPASLQSARASPATSTTGGTARLRWPS